MWKVVRLPSATKQSLNHSSCPSETFNHLSATYNLQQTTLSNFAAFSKITNEA